MNLRIANNELLSSETLPVIETRRYANTVRSSIEELTEKTTKKFHDCKIDVALHVILKSEFIRYFLKLL